MLHLPITFLSLNPPFWNSYLCEVMHCQTRLFRDPQVHHMVLWAVLFTWYCLVSADSVHCLNYDLHIAQLDCTICRLAAKSADLDWSADCANQQITRNSNTPEPGISWLSEFSELRFTCLTVQLFMITNSCNAYWINDQTGKKMNQVLSDWMFTLFVYSYKVWS